MSISPWPTYVHLAVSLNKSREIKAVLEAKSKSVDLQRSYPVQNYSLGLNTVRVHSATLQRVDDYYARQPVEQHCPLVFEKGTY